MIRRFFLRKDYTYLDLIGIIIAAMLVGEISTLWACGLVLSWLALAGLAYKKWGVE